MSINLYINIVFKCTDIEKLIKELENKIPANKLDWNRVKRQEELRAVDTLRRERDPNLIYNSKIEIEPTLAQADKPVTKTHGNILSQINYARKLPQMVEDATIMIVRDKNLMIKAGGYDINRSYTDLSIYSKIGFA